MKLNRSNILIFSLLILASALYRVWDSRPMGFAPQIAMALFAGSVIKDKKFSFFFPVISMLISDAIYHVLYLQGLSTIKGFYSGQLENYLLIASVTVIGFFMNNKKLSHVFIGSLAGAVYFYLISNFMVWIGGGLDINNLPYERSVSGILRSYTEAAPFFKWSVLATLVFNGIFFGVYQLAGKSILKNELKAI